MAKETHNQLDFQSLLQEIGENSSKIEKGNYEFTELTMQDQRKILNMGFNPIEIPVRLSNMYNDYIKSAITVKDDIVNVSRVVGVDIKPFLIVELRNVTLGNKYVDTEAKKTYTIREVLPEDFDRVIEPMTIKFNDFIIYLEVPTLVEDL